MADQEGRGWRSRRRRDPGSGAPATEDDQGPSLLGAGPHTGGFDRPRTGSFDRPRTGGFDRPGPAGAAGPSATDAEDLWTPRVPPRQTPYPRLLVDPPTGQVPDATGRARTRGWQPPAQGGGPTDAPLISPYPGATEPAGAAPSATPDRPAAPGSRRARRLAEAAAAGTATPAPGAAIPERTIPERTIPERTVPERTASPYGDAPAASPYGAAPAASPYAPAPTSPARWPVDGGRVDGGPVDGGPVDGGPVNGGPVDGGLDGWPLGRPAGDRSGERPGPDGAPSALPLRRRRERPAPTPDDATGATSGTAAGPGAELGTGPDRGPEPDRDGDHDEAAPPRRPARARAPGDPFTGPLAGRGEDEDEAPVRRGPLLAVTAVLLLGWAATGLLDVDGPGALVGLLAAVASLSPVASVGAVLVISFAVRGRRWITGGIALTAGLVPWAFAVPYAMPAKPPTGSLTGVQVLVVNAHEGDADPGDIAAAVRNESVDLLVVTELTSRLAHDLAVSGLDGRLVGRWVRVPDPGATGSAAQSGLGIWSRLPMSDFTEVSGTRWPAVRATLETGRGRLTVVAGHVVPPSLTSGGRWSSDLSALHDAGRVPGPVTVLGGLNGTPWNAQFRSAAGGGLHDAGDVLGRGIRPTWPSWLGLPLLPLDHALVGGRVGVQAMSGVSIDGTDHRALLVTLQVPDQG